MRKVIVILIVLTFCNASFSQNISREEANGLISALQKSKTDTARISIFLKIAKYHIYKSGEAKVDLDTGLFFINKAEQLNNNLNLPANKGNILIHKAYYFKEAGQRELAKASAENAITVLQNEKDKYLLGEAYMELSDYYPYETELEKKISLVQLATVCFERSGRTARKAKSYEILGDLLMQKDLTKASEALDSSLKAYKLINHKALQGVYILYATIYVQRSNYPQGLHYALLAVKTAEEVKDTSSQLCQINYITAVIYVHLQEHEKAIPYLYNALRIAEKFNDITSIYLVQYGICSTYLEINKATEAQELLDRIVKKYPQPTDDGTTLLQTRLRILISDQLDQLTDLEYYCSQFASLIENGSFSHHQKVQAYHTLIIGFLKLKKYSLSLRYLKKEEESLKFIPFSRRNATFYNYWFRLDTATKDYKSAVYHLLEYNKANDTIFSQAKTQEIQRLQIEFETETKDKNITLLTQEKKLQDAALKRSDLIRNIIIAAAAFLLVILFLLYNQVRLKQRSSKIIQSKNAVLDHILTERQWLLEEVHHRVKNNLQTVVSLLELQSENLRDEALSAIQDSQNRIYAMSLIHQKLYQTANVASIDMLPYLQELTAHLQSIYNPEHRINFHLQVAAVELDVSQAIPVGLIVNEAVTNSIKYAFKYGESSPEISISLKQNISNSLNLIVSDNGVGLQPGFDITSASGLGFKLIKGLVDDIEGTLTVDVEQGTFVTVVFDASIPFVDKVAKPKRDKALAI